jgi:AbrB family looped-hinge helix DNA binding protein
MGRQSNTQVMHYESNMTIKGQITVPKDIRDALGLKPGDAVEFVLDEDGNARIVRADDAARIEARKDAFLNRVKEVRAKFKPLDTMADSGMDGLAYQRFMRDGPEV